MCTVWQAVLMYFERWIYGLRFLPCSEMSCVKSGSERYPLNRGCLIDASPSVSSLELWQMATSGSQGLAFTQGSFRHEVLPRGGGLALGQHHHISPSTRHHCLPAERHTGPVAHVCEAQAPERWGHAGLRWDSPFCAGAQLSPSPMGGTQTEMILSSWNWAGWNYAPRDIFS